MRTKLIRGNCDDCGAEIKPAKDQRQFNRNIGLHRWRAHGIASPKANESKKYRLAKKSRNRVSEVLANVSPNGNLDASEKTFESLLSSTVPRRTPRKHVSSEETTPNAIPAKLSECPCCGTRFYMVCQ